MIDKLEQMLKVRVESNKVYVSRWQTELAENPTKIADSRQFFEAVAQTMVYQEVLNAIVHMRAQTVGVVDIDGRFKAWVTQEALQRAKNMEQSTSPTSNLYGDYIRATWAKVAEYNGFIL